MAKDKLIKSCGKPIRFNLDKEAMGMAS